MYCGNCGKEIENHSTVCPECGSKIEVAHNSIQKTDNQKIKRMMRRIIPVVAIIIIVFAGIKISSYVQGIPSIEEIQTAANNIQNNALVASDGKWIYYNDSGLWDALSMVCRIA